MWNGKHFIILTTAGTQCFCILASIHFCYWVWYKMVTKILYSVNRTTMDIFINIYIYQYIYIYSILLSNHCGFRLMFTKSGLLKSHNQRLATSLAASDRQLLAPGYWFVVGGHRLAAVGCFQHLPLRLNTFPDNVYNKRVSDEWMDETSNATW